MTPCHPWAIRVIKDGFLDGRHIKERTAIMLYKHHFTVKLEPENLLT